MDVKIGGHIGVKRKNVISETTCRYYCREGPKFRITKLQPSCSSSGIFRTENREWKFRDMVHFKNILGLREAKIDVTRMHFIVNRTECKTLESLIVVSLCKK
jgi:hypothetical protein